jgi:FHA domain
MASEDPGLPCLVVIGPARLVGLMLPLSPPEVVIGHSDTADVVLEDEFVSRRHALVTVDEAGVVTLSDLNSTAGTFVNDVLIDRPRVLRAGDLVRFADLVARFEPGMSSAASVAALDAPTRILPPSIGTETMPAADAPASGLVRGTVRDARGEPVSGVAVELVTWSVDPDAHVELARAACDEIGCYELEWDRGARLERLEVRVLDAGGRQVAVVELSERGEEWERVDIVVAVASVSDWKWDGPSGA